ncbi:hypothetical protein K490DRAFT_37359 [Saccharata proteae CBS 121410]|uniref:TPR-like protein n=1 Tax=Saccharata proteae CBS 121410 TaxID=1314787 RepID=A0A6A5YDD9_9PEZI|nr:hypothetical protein K490DRAFT_37359 [Saccharata proteae CBS 121410]
MIHVYARRADVGNAQRQFDRISTEFKLYPDIHCWNILLTAYCRQDDLEGASRLFNELLKSKLIPDPHSFSSILKLMAQRGDVDGVRHMLGVASDTNKNALRSTWVIGTLVSALINADSMESAELAVEEIYERHQRGEIEGSMTPILNNLLVAYARKRDIASTRRLYKHMIAREIRPDALTYAAFMQALALVHQTQAAWKILRTVVPDQNVSEIGMHYAICMAGFIMQEEYHLVELVDLRRSRRGIPDTLSVRLARELSKAKQGARDQKLMVPEDYANRRLPSAEKLLNLYLRDGDTGSLIATEPQLGLEETSLDRAGQSYFDILMTAYGDKGSHHLVQKLIDRYREIYQADAGNSQDKEAPPLRMIVALMHAHYQAGRYEEVESCWKMAVEQANRQARLIRPLESAGTQNSDVQADEVGPARRRILARPLGIYIRALQEQLRHKTVHSVVDSVLRSGYELDNQSWNIYIQNLARSGRISDAYSICEQYLMRDWPGWKKFARPTNRKTARGWHHLDVTPVTMPTELVLPQYKTMVILAAALQYVRKTDAIGSRTTGEDLVSEATLRSRAPSVVAAVETMPYVEDDLQTQFLSAN